MFIEYCYGRPEDVSHDVEGGIALPDVAQPVEQNSFRSGFPVQLRKV